MPQSINILTKRGYFLLRLYSFCSVTNGGELPGDWGFISQSRKYFLTLNFSVLGKVGLSFYLRCWHVLDVLDGSYPRQMPSTASSHQDKRVAYHFKVIVIAHSTSLLLLRLLQLNLCSLVIVNYCVATRKAANRISLLYQKQLSLSTLEPSSALF